MKIGPFEPKSVPAPVTAERKSSTGNAQAAAPAGRGEASAGTRVELGGVAALGLDLQAEGSFDAAKVERIAQAIRDGQFRIDAGAIADKLIANAQELLERRPS
jgi:negative regulator of flagellin synthesis FlgM